MSLFLLFLIGLTSVCFSTIFLMEQQPEEGKSTISNANPVSSRKNAIEGMVKPQMRASRVKVSKSGASVS